MHLRWDLANTPIDNEVPPDVVVLPTTNQIKVCSDDYHARSIVTHTYYLGNAHYPAWSNYIKGWIHFLCRTAVNIDCGSVSQHNHATWVLFIDLNDIVLSIYCHSKKRQWQRLLVLNTREQHSRKRFSLSIDISDALYWLAMTFCRFVVYLFYVLVEQWRQVYVESVMMLPLVSFWSKPIPALVSHR